jgi:uncharacterized membrane protein YfcA
LPDLLPPDVGPALALLLIAASFLTSATTAVFGLGGGVMQLAILAATLPALVVIPVHGIVQIGSNLGRAAVMRAHVRRPILAPFALGSALGVIPGALLVTDLPQALLQGVLGLFVLWACWTPKLKPTRIPDPAFVAVGAGSTFATMFLGATGPFVAAFVAPDRLTRQEVIATHAAAMTLQHGLKVGAFTALGFAFLPWLPLLALMIGSGFLGTLLGRRTLDRLPERAFKIAFKAILTTLALGLLWEAARAVWPR